MVSAREIQAVAELLQVSPEGLQKAITFKVTVSPWVRGMLSKPPASPGRSCSVPRPVWAPCPSPPPPQPVHPLGLAQRWVTSDPKGIWYQSPGLCLECCALFHAYWSSSPTQVPSAPGSRP